MVVIDYWSMLLKIESSVVFSLSTLILLNRTKPVIKQPPLYNCPTRSTEQASTQAEGHVEPGADEADVCDGDEDEGQSSTVRHVPNPNNGCDSTSSPSSLSSLSPVNTASLSFHQSMTDCSSHSNTPCSCSSSGCQTTNNNCSTTRCTAASAKFSMRKHKIVQTVLPSRFHIFQLGLNLTCLLILMIVSGGAFSGCMEPAWWHDEMHVLDIVYFLCGVGVAIAGRPVMPDSYQL